MARIIKNMVIMLWIMAIMPRCMAAIPSLWHDHDSVSPWLSSEENNWGRLAWEPVVGPVFVELSWIRWLLNYDVRNLFMIRPDSLFNQLWGNVVIPYVAFFGVSRCVIRVFGVYGYFRIDGLVACFTASWSSIAVGNADTSNEGLKSLVSRAGYSGSYINKGENGYIEMCITV